MNRPTRLLLGNAVGTFLLVVALYAHGQTYPTKPVRMVVGFPAGGGDDYIARLIATRMAEVLGQPVIVENRPGAGGLIGWQYVAKTAAADGYTLAFAGSSVTTMPSLRAKPPFDVVRDFAPISLIGTTSFVLVVHPSVPVKTAKELVSLAHAHPGKLNYASPGIGALGHIAAELLKSMARLDIAHVPYKGGQAIYPDLTSGRIDMYFAPLASGVPHVSSGRVRALGVTGRMRASVLPNVETIAEAALPGYEISGWYAIQAPRSVPRDIVNKLNAATQKAVTGPDVRERLVKGGVEPHTNTPDEMADIVKASVKKFGNIIRAAGIKPD